MDEEMTLAEKAALFEWARRFAGDGDDEDLDEGEELRRERCRRFFLSPGARPAELTRRRGDAAAGMAAGTTARPRRTPRRIPWTTAAAEKMGEEAEGDGGVVKGTPVGAGQNAGMPGKKKFLLARGGSADDPIDVVPDSARARSKTAQRGGDQNAMPAPPLPAPPPPPSSKRSITALDDTPSRPGTTKTKPTTRTTVAAQAPGKRRKGDLNMRPEREQVLRGLRLFYIPDNDIAPARRLRITRAREFGAERARGPREATHVVVDRGIRYDEIRGIIVDEAAATPAPGSAQGPGPVVVDENYPIDCIRFRTLLDHGQKKYMLEGQPAEREELPPPEEPTTGSTAESLQLKAPPRRSSRKWDYAPPQGTPRRSEESSQGPGGEGSARASQGMEIQLGVTATGSADTAGSRAEAHGQSKGDAVGDELSGYIDMMQEYKDLPLDMDDDEDDGHSKTTAPEQKDQEASPEPDSDGEGARRKLRGRRKRSAGGKDTAAWEDGFACHSAGARDAGAANPNSRTMEVLQRMAAYYDRVGDRWRTLAYRKAATQLRGAGNGGRRVCTAEEALRLPGVGASLASKIEEIATTDRLRTLEHAEADPAGRALRLFTGIYGVGAGLAQKWVARGLRTLGDVRERAKLTPNQAVGLERYDDLNARIPRAEVEALGRAVRDEARRVDAAVEVIVGGSYRRGAESSGDIDLLVTKPGTSSSGDLGPFLDELVRRLWASGFLAARLASSSSRGGDPAEDTGSKWHGCCVLPPSSSPSGKEGGKTPVWRRIDILLVPATELGAALIYFTGNDIFNRSLRLLASKKGMRLNQRGLYREAAGAARTRSGDGRGRKALGRELVEARDERRIFEVLGVRWREPHERWC
ncbi:hypothetical protein N3K66_002508 [Trichothecium roseum]|uniref:Uncharacterized protein n=1 Tax=Trichothecium roseum TaxID=47278 RepID=A0ACC0VB78_9HYPO|nr:hypothetical protein N3K66_002508 [Trichothecium roseum]